MQTFLPVEDYRLSAACLDSPRLGKQRSEVLAIARGLIFGNRTIHHPASKMWENNIVSLLDYGMAVCEVWINRGNHDTVADKLYDLYLEINPERKIGDRPKWIGGLIHSNHRARLLAKNPAWYSQWGWTEEPTEYNYWPTKD